MLASIESQVALMSVVVLQLFATPLEAQVAGLSKPHSHKAKKISLNTAISEW